MSGKAIAIVGMRGMGKSTITKEMVKESHPDARLIHDINGEYKELYSKPLMPFDEFEDKTRKVQNAVIVVEEATVFLNNRSFSFDFLDTVVRARHANNTLILVFHSLRAIPKYLFELLNYVVILKTQDRLKEVEKIDNPNLTKAFKEIKKAPLLTNKETGKQYSPHIVVDMFAPAIDDNEETQNEDE